MKQVHDVLNITIDSPIVDPSRPANSYTFPVAFIQWGNEDDGFQYEIVCPWCAKSIGWALSNGNMDEVRKAMATAQALHHKAGDCTRFGSSTFDVERARGPLNTSKLPTIQ